MNDDVEYADVIRVLNESSGDPTILLKSHPDFEDYWFTLGGELDIFQDACATLDHNVVKGMVGIVGQALLSANFYDSPYGVPFCALHAICEAFGDAKNWMKLLRWVLDQDAGLATLNTFDCEGRTPLFIVTQVTKPLHILAVLRLLLRYGANPVLRSKDHLHNELTPRELYQTFSSTTALNVTDEAVTLLQAAEDAWQCALILFMFVSTPTNLSPTVCLAGESVGAWRPHKHIEYPKDLRARIRTVAILAKARTTNDARSKRHRRRMGDRSLTSTFAKACLELLPEELMQYVFVFITGSPVAQFCATLN
jgi:hypothetical protein